ncbi:MAG: helix-turn-helix domain-containing protein [Sphingomonadaceae bacterium]|nr:helix-turn-helix domain-containing protein [Sphingomonadaceae bacterium]
MLAPSTHPKVTMSGGVEAVDRALAILATFARGRERQTLAQIASRTGFYKSTILRLARSLEQGGYLRRGADGVFTLGPQPLHLAAIYKRGLRLEDQVRPVLRALVAETGESASFFRREGDRRLCLYREESPRAIRDHIVEGDLLPLDVGAAGHVLACAGETATIVSQGERDPETAAIAAPIHDPSGLVGALTLSGPRARFDTARTEAMTTLLSAQAAVLTSRLGGRIEAYHANEG